MTTTCDHPADNVLTSTILMECPDCGAKCSGTSIGDDRLCYDAGCPLHVGQGNFGSLREYKTSDIIRPATGDERRASIAAAEHDGGRGVIMADGRPCYVD